MQRQMIDIFEDFLDEFLSPCGEMIMQPLQDRLQQLILKKFLSPCGEMIMQQVFCFDLPPFESFYPLAEK